MASPDRTYVISYILFALLFVMVGWLKLTTTLVAVLFAYLALRTLSFGRLRWLAVILFFVLLLALFYGFARFANHSIVALPSIAKSAIPEIVRFATEHGIELPFTDMESLKTVAFDSVYSLVGYLGNFAKVATKESLFVIVGVVVGTGIFLNPKLDYDQSPRPLNLYSLYCARIAELFGSLYLSFQAVMGAQVIISSINTLLTSIFIYGSGLPHALLVIVVTFLCGLLPVIGNILSNTLIVGIAFTVSPQFAGWALLFLVAIHKLEYFLNSKIIGSRIRHPMWLTLLMLILGERLMGIAGIILAPVALHFLKCEASRFTVERERDI